MKLKVSKLPSIKEYKSYMVKPNHIDDVDHSKVFIYNGTISITHFINIKVNIKMDITI